MAAAVKKRPNAEPASDPQYKLQQLRKELNAALVGRQDEIDLTLTALVGQTSLMFIGPHGAAKSMCLEMALKQIQGASYFSRLMGKFTEPRELLGPTDIAALKEGKNRCVTKGMLPEAHAAFLDEYWKASTAIANTLLKITNERVFDNGDGERPVPLRTLVVASNEYPQDANELAAMFDRFVIRAEVRYVSGRANHAKLLREGGKLPRPTATFTLADWDAMTTAAKALPMSEQGWAVLGDLVEELIREGVRPSDRRLTKVESVLQAYAYVLGAAEVRRDHFEVLQYVLWDQPGEQQKKARQIIARVANPVGMAVADLLFQAEDLITKAPPAEAVAKLKTINRELERLLPDPRAQAAIGRVVEINKAALNATIHLKDNLEGV